MSCKLKHKDSKSNTKEVMMSNGAIDSFYKITNLGIFRSFNTKLSDLATSKYGVTGRLYLEDNNRAIPNTPLFNQIDKKRKELGLYDNQERANVISKPVFQFKEGKAKDLVIEIANSGGTFAPLANKLKERIGDVKVKSVQVGSDKYKELTKVTGLNDFQGLYVPSDDIIYMVEGNTIDFEKTLLHEVLHHLTAFEIRRPGNKEKIESIYQRVLMELEKNNISTSIYALKNIDEFVVGLFTDPKLVKILTDLPGESTSIWKDIVDFLKSMIGVEKQDTLFDEVIKDVVTMIGDRSTEYFTFEGLEDLSMASIEESIRVHSNIYLLEDGITNEKIDSIYENYKNLMNIRREGKELPKDKFIDLLKNLQVLKHNNTYLFGNYDSNTATFIVRFNSSPTSKELLKDTVTAISESGLDVINFVPEEYAKKLERSGYTISKKGFDYNFKGEQMVKYAAASNPGVFNKIFGKDNTQITGKEIEEYNNSTQMKFVSVDISANDIKQINKDINSILENYLSKFGIKVEDINNLQESLKIDSLGFTDILNKIAFVKDKNNLPNVAGEFIAYMMQYNPLITNIINELIQKDVIPLSKDQYTIENGIKKYDYKKINKTEYFKYIGRLISNDLKNKVENKNSITDKIKELLKRIFEYFSDVNFQKINESVGVISNNILQQNKNLITSSIYKPGAIGKKTEIVGVEKALEKDKFGKEIIYELSKKGFILTGSIALSEQGTIYRPDENMLHDIDWVSPFKRTDTISLFYESYPEAIKIRDIYSETYYTDSFLIAPKYHSIKNFKSETFNGKTVVTSYDVFKDENLVGTYRVTNEDGISKEVIEGIEGKIIDFFSYESDNENTSKYFEYTLDNGNKLLLSDWRLIFEAKLNYSRYKDIWDYNRFIPNINKVVSSPGLPTLTLTQEQVEMTC